MPRAEPATVEDVVVPVAQAADLVLLKLFAGGPQDLWDVAQRLGAHDAGAITTEVERRLSARPAESGRLWARGRRGT